MELAEKKCVPCAGGVAPLKGSGLDQYALQLQPEWKVKEEHHLEREFEFKDFRGALQFTNRVGELAESEGHHPDIYLAWGKVKVTIWTHKIDGLTESDFILAAKIERLSGWHLEDCGGYLAPSNVAEAAHSISGCHFTT
jgi:4a-hydroxytetrahydrobiopterin dehydratase